MIPSSTIEIVVTCCNCKAHRTASNGWFEVWQEGVKLNIVPMGKKPVETTNSFVCSDSCLQQIVQGYANEIRGAVTVHSK